MHVQSPSKSTRFLAPLSLSLSLSLFLFLNAFFISTASAQAAEIPFRPLPPGHEPDHNGDYFPPKPAQPEYYPAEHPVPFFFPQFLDITAPLLRTLAHYDRFAAHYEKLTRIERVAGIDRLIRHLPDKRHEAPAHPRHVATFGQPRPADAAAAYNGTDDDGDTGPLVAESAVVDQILARAAKREAGHINYWDHPWEGHRCYTRQCKTDWDCTHQKCSSCVYFRCA